MEIRMPKLGVAMTEGFLVTWLVADGAEVTAGTPIYSVETEKVESDVEAPLTGRLSHVIPAGTSCPVGTVVAQIE
jgi:pyruvate/2-oxoglutarate dehydrogenase complex dihydrolipoamide acyltransferase (E2) component